MKNKFLKLALSAMLLSTTVASAEVVSKNAATFRPYAKVMGGFIKPTKRDGVDYKWGGKGSAAFGVSYNEWDIELELGYCRANVKDHDLLARWNALSGMINLIYNYSFTESIFAYVGAGAGVASVGYKTDGDMQGLNVSVKLNDITTFAWQLFAGLGYQINENWDVRAGYRMFNTTKAKLGSFGNADLEAKQPFVHNIEFGLTYRF